MGPPAKRRRLAEPELPTDENNAFDEYDSDDERTVDDLDAFDQRAKQAKLSNGNGKDDKKLLHRRQVVVTADMTVAVEDTVTVTVEVDSNGLPTTTVALPSVPSVPAFPSDLTVPAVPAFPTESLPAVPSVPQLASTLAAATANSITQVVLQSPPATPLPGSALTNNGTSASSAPFATFSAPFNGGTFVFTVTALPTTNISVGSAILGPTSTGMTTNMSFPSNSSTLASTATGLFGNSSLFGTTTSASSVTTLSTSTISGSSSESESPTSATGGVGGVGSGSGETGSPNPGSGSGSGGNNGSNNNTPAPGLVAGAVTGSVGGAAILLLLLVIFVRWLRRRNAAIGALPQGGSSTSGLRPGTGSGPNMAQRSLLPAAAVGALSRLSGMGRPKSSLTLPAGEQGFQKLSGRKMPSQFGSDFDQGPMATDFAAAAAGRPQRNTMDTTLSEQSFYRDSRGFYGGLGESPERPAGPLAGDFAGPSHPPPQTAPNPETMRPSPARTPVIHQGGPWSTDYPQSPPATASTNLTPRRAESTTLGRSHQDSSHSTRFTEEL